MAGEIVVLLGPTLPVAEARTHLDAIYLPPAEQGSVFRAVVEHRPAVLAIIDGAFAQRPAVRHKEILWAMAGGVEVHGAASMGALRAAELAPYGMIGHGFVYRWYRRTPLADDEEVAVAMAPPELGSAALGEALINMRLTLRRAERRGVVGRARARGARRAGPRAVFPRPQLWRDDRGARGAPWRIRNACRDRRARRVAPRERGRLQARRRHRAPAPPGAGAGGRGCRGRGRASR